MSDSNASVLSTLRSAEDRVSDDRRSLSLFNQTSPSFSLNQSEIAEFYDGGSLKLFNAEYQKLHGYISISVCVCGIVANTLNAIVLSRKSMQSATNFLLTALAVTDLLTMTSYLPYAAYFYCIATPDVRYPHRREWIIYLLFNTNFIITSHTVAMWLTVSLAIFRYVVVCRKVSGPGPCTLQRAKVTAAAVVIATIVFCSPNYVMHRPYRLESGAYWFKVNDFITSYLEIFNYWVFGVVLKVAPCVLLSVLSTLLLLAMRRADRRRARLKSQGRREESDRTREHNRTTAMLVTVVLFFVLSELPQGVLALLSGMDDAIFHSVYVPLGDVWDIIVLVNSAVNFILYCIMSRQFRQTFYGVFCQRCQQRRDAANPANAVQKKRCPYAIEVKD